MMDPAKLRPLLIGLVLYVLLLASIGLIGIGIVGLLNQSIVGAVLLIAGIILLLIIASTYIKLYRNWRKHAQTAGTTPSFKSACCPCCS